MRKPVVVYSEFDSPGLRYVLDFVFNTWFGTGYELVDNVAALNAPSPLVNYNTLNIPNALSIFPSGRVFGSNGLSIERPEIEDWEGLPCFFHMVKSDIPFDLFGAIFFLLTRSEEYATGPRDAHGRFLSIHSVFSGTDIIDRPIVDEWLSKFGEKLADKYPAFIPKARSYTWLNTFDIDVAYAYKHRTLGRLIGACAKDLLTLNFPNLISRVNVLVNGRPDPFDTYDLQNELAPSDRAETIYFMLMGDSGKYDKNLSHRSAGVRKLANRLSERAKIGIHPSYASNSDEAVLRMEIDRLKKMIDSDVVLSRQHYLKISFPNTYRRLVAAGITEDYSLGYSDRPGFRSGTCTPHYFYDIERQETTELKLFPLIAMDATLRDYMGLDQKDASQLLKELITKVNAVDGTFISLWHNESLSDVGEWEGWREVYTQMADDAAIG